MVSTQKKDAGSLPKYIQLSELIIREMDAGRLLDGERLAPERDMARTYGTSVGTLRKALADLAQKGLLRRVQGSGNYVQTSEHPAGLYAMFRLELLAGGGLPTADVLAVDTLEKPSDLPTFGSSEQATRIRRRRRLNGVAIAAEEIWLDASMGTLTRAVLSDSLYQTYLKRLKFWVTRAEDRVSVGILPKWAPQDVGPRDAPCGYIERFSWAETREAVEFSRTWFDPSRAIYVQRLK